MSGVKNLLIILIIKDNIFEFDKDENSLSITSFRRAYHIPYDNRLNGLKQNSEYEETIIFLKNNDALRHICRNAFL